jgi:hypothetical protein
VRGVFFFFFFYPIIDRNATMNPILGVIVTILIFRAHLGSLLGGSLQLFDIFPKLRKRNLI